MIWCCERLVLSYTSTVWAQDKIFIIISSSILYAAATLIKSTRFVKFLHTEPSRGGGDPKHCSKGSNCIKTIGALKAVVSLRPYASLSRSRGGPRRTWYAISEVKRLHTRRNRVKWSCHCHFFFLSCFGFVISALVLFYFGCLELTVTDMYHYQAHVQKIVINYNWYVYLLRHLLTTCVLSFSTSHLPRSLPYSL